MVADNSPEFRDRRLLCAYQQKLRTYSCIIVNDAVGCHELLNELTVMFQNSRLIVLQITTRRAHDTIIAFGRLH